MIQQLANMINNWGIRMKVCYIITTTINSGPVNVLYNTLVNYHKVDNFIPEIVTLKPDDESKSRQADFEKLGIKVNHFFNKKTQFKDIQKYIDKNHFDVVHSHGLIPDMINSYVKQHTEQSMFHITTQHNYPFEDYPQRKGKLLGTVMAELQIKAIQNLYKVACSNAIAQKFEKKKIKTTVIQNGIIFPENYRTIPRTNLRPIFLYLGRIHDRKNVSFLVDYFQYHPQYEFWIVGDGAKADYIAERTKNISNIIFFGKTEKPAEFYQKADYYISSSKSEGLPLSVLEAMSYGLPCVLSDIPSHQEIMTSDDYGVIYQNNNSESLNQAIQKTVATTYDGYQIYSEMKNRFDAKVMMDKYLQIYCENEISGEEK